MTPVGNEKQTRCVPFEYIYTYFSQCKNAIKNLLNIHPFPLEFYHTMFQVLTFDWWVGVSSISSNPKAFKARPVL